MPEPISANILPTYPPLFSAAEWGNPAKGNSALLIPKDFSTGVLLEHLARAFLSLQLGQTQKTKEIQDPENPVELKTLRGEWLDDVYGKLGRIIQKDCPLKRIPDQPGQYEGVISIPGTNQSIGIRLIKKTGEKPGYTLTIDQNGDGKWNERDLVAEEFWMSEVHQFFRIPVTVEKETYEILGMIDASQNSLQGILYGPNYGLFTTLKEDDGTEHKLFIVDPDMSRDLSWPRPNGHPSLAAYFQEKATKSNYAGQNVEDPLVAGNWLYRIVKISRQAGSRNHDIDFAVRQLLPGEVIGKVRPPQAGEASRGLVGEPIIWGSNQALNQGDKFSWDAYKGKIVLLDFWAFYCAQCLEKIPSLQKLSDEMDARYFSVVGINMDSGISASVLKKELGKYAEGKNLTLTYTNIWDFQGKIFQDWAIQETGIPYACIVDADTQMVLESGPHLVDPQSQRERVEYFVGLKKNQK